MQKHVTMQQIAREAGVSTATVSRVLTGHPLVGKETRKRVQDIIDYYHYTPNSLARSLVRRQSNMLGMLVQDISNPYFSSMYLDAERRAVDQGYTLLMASSLSFESEKIALQHMCERQVEGVLVISSSLDGPQQRGTMVNEILELQRIAPVVLINDPIEGVEVPFVAANNYEGYRTAMDHLFALGHRDIAFIGGTPDNLTMRLRHQAYVDAYTSRSLTPDDAFTAMLGFTHQDGQAGLSQVLSSGRLPTAVLCANDMVAIGVLNLCYAQRLNVPNDISIISCDNTFISEGLHPGLTSIDIAPGKQGETAMDELLSLIRGERVPPVTLVPSRLIVRGSTAKARKEL